MDSVLILCPSEVILGGSSVIGVPQTGQSLPMMSVDASHNVGGRRFKSCPPRLICDRSRASQVEVVGYRARLSTRTADESAAVYGDRVATMATLAFARVRFGRSMPSGFRPTMRSERTQRTGANGRPESTSWGHWFEPSTAHHVNALLMQGFLFLVEDWAEWRLGDACPAAARSTNTAAIMRASAGANPALVLLDIVRDHRFRARFAATRA